MGNKGRVASKMVSIKDSTSVLAIQNYVQVRRAKVPRKQLKIDRCMEYAQSRLIDWEHVEEVNEDLLANPPDGRLQLLLLLGDNHAGVAGPGPCMRPPPPPPPPPPPLGFER